MQCDVKHVQHFLAADGEMAQRFRAFDWSKHILGPIDSWDQCLKTAVGLMLRSAFPQFIAWGKDRIFLYNDAYMPILGTEKHPWALGSHFEAVWADIWSNLAPIVAEVDQGRSRYFEDLPLLMNRHGYYEQTYFTFSYSPILDEAGDVSGLFCSCVETTARKKTEDDLRASESRFRHLAAELRLKSDALENSLNGFDIVNAEGKLIYANQAYLNMWGYDHLDEIIGMSPASHCADPETPEKIIRALKERGECNIEFLAQRKNGTTFHVNMWARLAHDSEGNEIYPSTSIDITQRKQVETSLRLAKEEAERANQLKSTFLANMSHEIRTPLGAMLGFADLLCDRHISTAERETYIDVLIRNGEQLSVIINDILDLSKVEAGHLSFEFVSTRPSVIAADVLSLMGVKAKEKGLELEYCEDSSAPAAIVTDPGRVRQILLNLVSNAIKFTNMGQVLVRCFGLPTEAGSKQVAFEIVDTGIGIPSDQSERIFDMFAQGDESMTRRFGGTGLGLALSRRLARELGGDVTLRSSTPQRGSTFLFTIADKPGSRTDKPRVVSPNKAVEVALSPRALQGVRVLVVDDAPDNQQLLIRLLSKQGATVESVSNGQEGYQQALTREYDVILMDIQMPVMDGYTATQKLREQGYGGPIIALTAHAMTEVRRKCLNVGCDDHLSKPINARELVVKIAGLLRA